MEVQGAAQTGSEDSGGLHSASHVAGRVLYLQGAGGGAQRVVSMGAEVEAVHMDEAEEQEMQEMLAKQGGGEGAGGAGMAAGSSSSSAAPPRNPHHSTRFPAPRTRTMFGVTSVPERMGAMPVRPLFPAMQAPPPRRKPLVLQGDVDDVLQQLAILDEVERYVVQAKGEEGVAAVPLEEADADPVLARQLRAAEALERQQAALRRGFAKAAPGGGASRGEGRIAAAGKTLSPMEERRLQALAAYLPPHLLRDVNLGALSAATHAALRATPSLARVAAAANSAASPLNNPSRPVTLGSGARPRPLTQSERARLQALENRKNRLAFA